MTAMLVTESEIMDSGLLSLFGLGLSVSWAPGLDGDATPPVPVGVCVSNYTAQSSPVPSAMLLSAGSAEIKTKLGRIWDLI